MEFYCLVCETAVCEECSSDDHAEHVTVPFTQVVTQHKSSLLQQLNSVRSRSGNCTYTALSFMIRLDVVMVIMCGRDIVGTVKHAVKEKRTKSCESFSHVSVPDFPTST